MKRSSRLRKTGNLSESVHQQLNTYALAAGAAGVGALCFGQPAEAKVVYTPAHLKIPLNTDFFLDLNHDGTNDFVLFNYSLQCHANTCGAGVSVGPGRTGNEMWGEHDLASALRAGVRIGGRGHSNFSRLAGNMAEFFSSPGTHGRFEGPWANGGKGVKNRYLGFKFQINGRIHFGWARLNVSFDRGFTALLTGYAYETIPDKSIIAGATKGPDAEPAASLNPPTPEPATLGALAMGAPGLSIWRRKESGELRSSN
jgi:hypothetical protein